jgi:hypothetical protein
MGYGVLGQPTVDTLQPHRHVEARQPHQGENKELKTENSRLSEG